MAWPSLTREIKASKQLLVEGRTPEIFFREWIEALGLKEQVEVRSYNSLSELTDYLRLFTGYAEFRANVKSLAIIRDAETNAPADAFQSVCSSLKAVNLEIPSALGEFSHSTPRTGIYILPDCLEVGMLETMCWNALKSDPSQARHLVCVENYVECLK